MLQCVLEQAVTSHRKDATKSTKLNEFLPSPPLVCTWTRVVLDCFDGDTLILWFESSGCSFE